jgi:hypothetical protein
MMIAQSSQDA